MGGLWNEMEMRSRRLGIAGVKLAQGAAMGLALAAGKLFPEIMDLCVWWFLGFALLCAPVPLVRFFGSPRD